MPDPNDSSRRRRRSSIPKPSTYGPYNHPYLTPRGFRLLNESPLVDDGVHARLPDPAAPDDTQKEDLELISEDSGELDRADEAPRPGPFFAKSPNGWNEGYSLIQNVLPSRKFPNPQVLATKPLDDHFASETVSRLEGSQLRAVGRLVIHLDRTRWGEPAFGSAWVVGKNMIATCAHNLFDFTHQTWSRAVEFYPGFDYYAGGEPVFCHVTSGYISRRYTKNPATNHDIAFCYVDRDIGDIIDATIPIQPPESNEFFENNKVTIVGYPGGSEFDFGKQMWKSRGAYLFGRSNGPGDDFAPAMATNFGAGSSGCPWLSRDPITKKIIAVGITSGHAKLHYQRGEMNLMSLTSPMLTQTKLDRLLEERVEHEFEV